MKPSVIQKIVIKRISYLLKTWYTCKNIDLFTLENDIQEVFNNIEKLYDISVEERNELSNTTEALLFAIRNINKPK